MLPVPRPRSANKEWEQLKHEIEVAHDLVMWSCSAVREGNADPSAALASGRQVWTTAITTEG